MRTASINATAAPLETYKPKLESSLRYALVSDWLAVCGGAEQVFGEICKLLPGLVYSSQCNQAIYPWLENREIRTSFVQHLPYALTKHYVYAPLMPSVYRTFDFSAADVLVVTSHSFAHHCIMRPGAPYLCYYHTPARSLWNPEIDDRASHGHLAWARKLLAPRMKRLDLAASRHPTYIVANSKTTAGRIQTHYGRQVDEVIYPPVDTRMWSSIERKSDDAGFVMWGRQVAYKRTDLAIEAVRVTGDPLHVVGTGPMIPILKNQASGMKNVHFHGRLPDEHLTDLVAQARAVLFPGYEDFGIVPVEAMAAGLPVIAYGVGGAAETIGDLGVQFQTQTTEDLVEAIGRLRFLKVEPSSLRARASAYDVSVFRSRFLKALGACIDRGGIREEFVQPA
jgi:glycosyltransferase involved in cell wall biosynthesis